MSKTTRRWNHSLPQHSAGGAEARRFDALTSTATLAALISAFVVSPGDARTLGLVDSFVISLGDTVADGVPGSGAGNLEAPGSVDEYLISLRTDTLVYFNEISGPCNILWRCEAPDGTLLFNDQALCVGDPGAVLLDQTGDYTITAYSNSGATGTYSFSVTEVPPPDVFAIAIGDSVSDGVPGPGAGHIEQPGSVDQYTVNVASDELVYFDEMSGSCALLWRCEAPDGEILFDDQALCVGDPDSILLDQTGEYLITAYGGQSTIGTYSFTLWSVPPPEHFAIAPDQIVSDGVPGPGAGVIESPGAIDVYSLAIADDTMVYFDELGGSCSIVWRCEAPDGTVLFTNEAMCVGDPGERLLDQPGNYTITVSGNQGAIDAYSFEVVTVAKVDAFTLDLEQTVSDGVPGPGAGNIEEPASIDRYTLSVSEDVLVYFDELDDANCGLRWRCEAPDGSALFTDNPLCTVDPEAFLLDQTGDYIIEAYGAQGTVGTYSFIVWQVNDPEVFAVDKDELIEVDVPGPGAGVIEEPGARDVYLLTVPEGNDRVCVEPLDGGCGLRWSCEAPDGSMIVVDAPWCDGGSGKVSLDLPGEYTFSVRGMADTVGAYSLIINTDRAADFDGDCHVNVFDLLVLLSAWGTCGDPEDCPADLSGDSTVDVFDLLALLGEWG